MGYTIGTISARQVTTANPSTLSVTILTGETLLVLTLVANGGTDRAGGAPTYGAVAMTQASTTQKAATSPEQSAELWYLLNPPVGTANVSIPNTGGISLRWHAVAAKTRAGGRSMFLAAAGANATSTNPTVTVNTGAGESIFFAVVGNGATTWAPSGRTGTQISDTDAGANGDGHQYLIKQTAGAQAMSWTFGTSDDWGLVAAAFGEVPANHLTNYVQSVTVGNNCGCSEKIA